jgi:TonB family protein
LPLTCDDIVLTFTSIMRLFLASLALSAFALLIGVSPIAQPAPQTPSPDQTQINSLADRLAHDIHSKHLKHHESPKVLVTDFLNDQNLPNLFGQRVADALSAALQPRLPAAQLIPRKNFQDRLVADALSLKDLKNKDAVEWYTSQVGANLVVTGHFSAPKDNHTSTLELELTDISEEEQLASIRADLTLPPDGAKVLALPGDWPTPPPERLCHTGANYRYPPGTSFPRCVYCPPPSYTDAARRHKLDALVVLLVQIDEQGHPTSAVVVSGAPYGLSDQAAKAVLRWQLSPATKDNQPVATCTAVEVAFRLR